MFPEVPGHNQENSNKNGPDEEVDVPLVQTDSSQVDARVETEMRGQRVDVPEIATLDDFDPKPLNNSPAFTRGKSQRMILPSSARKRGVTSLPTGQRREISIGAAPALKPRERVSPDSRQVKDPGVETMRVFVASILDKHNSPLTPVIIRADSPGRTKRYTLELRQPKSHKGQKLVGHGMRFTATGKEILRDLEQYLDGIN